MQPVPSNKEEKDKDLFSQLSEEFSRNFSFCCLVNRNFLLLTHGFQGQKHRVSSRLDSHTGKDVIVFTQDYIS